MLNTPLKREVDHRTLKLLVGVIALTLANLTSFFSGSMIASISESFYVGGWSQTVFIGFLFAIAAFLLARNGYSRAERIVFSNALFPSPWHPEHGARRA